MTAIPERMLRVAKHAGVGNVVMEEVDVPRLGPTEVLVKLEASLISRGSEILRRYRMEQPVDHSMMGYSDAGVVAALGDEVDGFEVGERVCAVAPHAQYVIADTQASPYPRVVRIPEAMSFEAATFLPLATSSNVWCRTADIQRDETVLVVGQGLVGSLCMQIAKQYRPRQLIATDALPLRCELAHRLGAEHVVNVAERDPVVAVRELTDGKGAEVVLETVGGPPGIESFRQSLDMCAAGGRVVLIALYHGEPLPLDASAVMSKRIIGGNIEMTERREWASAVSLKMIVDGRLRVDEMVSHRFPYTEAPEAFHLLNDRLGEALGVVLEWT